MTWLHNSTETGSASIGVPASAALVLPKHDLIAPEILEARGRKFGVADGVLDVAVAEIILDRSCVMSIASQLEASGVAQHMRMSLERKARFFPRPLHQPIKAIDREGPPAFAHKHER